MNRKIFGKRFFSRFVIVFAEEFYEPFVAAKSELVLVFMSIVILFGATLLPTPFDCWFFLHFRSKIHLSVVWFGLISFRSFFRIILLEFITSNQCKHQMGVLINECSSSKHTISASIHNKYAKISKIVRYNEPIYHFRWKFYRLDFVSMH